MIRVTQKTRRFVVFGNPDGRESILCRACRLESHHPADVEARYCGRCHVFHRDEEVKARLQATEGVRFTPASRPGL